MGLMSRLAERREAHILTHCQPHLRAGESVTAWTRVRTPAEGREGFAYLTPTCLVTYWLDRDEATAIALADVRAWGLSLDTPGGPVLAVESPGAELVTQFPTGTEAVTAHVRGFLDAFARAVPESSNRPGVSGYAVPTPEAIGGITTEARTWGRRTRRIVVTVAGLALTAIGILLALPLVPGPGILVAIAGVALLASEYDWAKDALNWAQNKTRGGRQRLGGRNRRPAE